MTGVLTLPLLLICGLAVAAGPSAYDRSLWPHWVSCQDCGAMTLPAGQRP